MTTATLPPPRRVFYGWYVVAAVFVITMTTSGLAFYNLSILLAAFVAERGFPVGLASTATAAFFVAGGIGGVIAGRLVDRIDARLVIAGGASIGALALASAGLLRELWQLYAFHVVFGLCHGASGLVPVTTWWRAGSACAGRWPSPSPRPASPSAASSWRRSWPWPSSASASPARRHGWASPSSSASCR